MKKYILDNLKVEDVFISKNKKCVCGHTGCFKHYKNTNTWYCHSREIGKNVIDLVMYKNDCDFKTAINICCDILGITQEKKNTITSISKTPENLKKIKIKKILFEKNKSRIDKFINFVLNEICNIHFMEIKNIRDVAYKDVYNRFLERELIEIDKYKNCGIDNLFEYYIDCERFLNNFFRRKNKLNEEYKTVLKFLK